MHIECNQICFSRLVDLVDLIPMVYQLPSTVKAESADAKALHVFFYCSTECFQLRVFSELDRRNTLSSPCSIEGSRELMLL